MNYFDIIRDSNLNIIFKFFRNYFLKLSLEIQIIKKYEHYYLYIKQFFDYNQ